MPAGVRHSTRGSHPLPYIHRVTASYAVQMPAPETSDQNMLSQVWLPNRNARFFFASQRALYLYFFPWARLMYSRRCSPPAIRTRSATLRR